MHNKNIGLKDRVIFALDVDSGKDAERWIDILGSHINFYKVGLQLFLAEGFQVIDMITRRGHNVMCDLKFFDVPATVKSAVSQLKNRGITFATVHGNDPILRAAVEVERDFKILAVTVLTSFCDDDMKEMGMIGSIDDLVYLRARKALELGCDGVVSSGLEVSRLRKNIGNDFIVVTPGIRPGKNIETNQDDQKRIVTAKEAIANGADHVVIGRPIRAAKEPIALVENIQKEISEVLTDVL